MRKKRSKILDAVQKTAKGLHAAGAINQKTMRQLDQLHAQPVSRRSQRRADAR